MNTVVAITGPTASGKSRLAMRLARELGGEIVNADALQVYRGFDIGTAKPTGADRDAVRHHLIDILDPAERYSAGEFARRARHAIGEIEQRAHLPLVVGGSGLYVRALFDGIARLPEVPEAVRNDLAARLEREGLPALRRELERVDPATAARLAPRDRQRTLRALEVLLATGRPLSVWLREDQDAGERPSSVRIGLTAPRAILYDRVAVRVHRMVESGWMEEVRTLLDSGLDPSLPAFQAIGYRELARVVAGQWSLDRALEATISATRKFVKRQLTWFRAEAEIHWFDLQRVEEDLSELLKLLTHSGIRRRGDET
ncbi:MAG TPA: tRNA (adenosine(37)-N6)-dimethylallyltransferase MiaA [Thermoanaerobaculia bacterium]|nr:tRNA (adenosine(37)-N6)-dimethylallyltransferase MiaA [Thermoanaerobaculia bacterium]